MAARRKGREDMFFSKEFLDNAEKKSETTEYEPEYIGEDTGVGYRLGKCKCGNSLRSYQIFCDYCGVRLRWKGKTST